MNIEVITTNDPIQKKSGFGGHSSCNDIVASIQRTGNSVKLTVCESEEDLRAVVAREPDLVVLAQKFTATDHAEDIWFSEYFSKHKITFSGSDREILRFDSNKASAKIHLANMRIKTARHFTAVSKQFLSPSSLPLDFPLFIKSVDNNENNGIDELSYVKTFAAFETKVNSICSHSDQVALVEEYLPGRDFTVAIICNSTAEMTVSPMEVLRQANQYSSVSRCIKIEDPDVRHRVNELAKSAFLGLGIRDFGLIDVRMNNYGECFFMDANLVPNMTIESSYFLRACAIANNLSYDQVIGQMLNVLSSRARADKIHNKVLQQRSLHWPRASVSKLL
ncbi:D-alanine--D-alanine ligase [Paraglaciecola arctica]|uniref:D-alanine--D-alanine ligase n=1 Tax=Paraglaciecola arctica TaxID=1128911 RepID=UPI001C068C9B|nr:D-alanine--D-alanine ligase [Paraglaciecola arctica]MBU3002018.1 D-alanine--D-alanine ligase [Paraglaciecola arctica]